VKRIYRFAFWLLMGVIFLSACLPARSETHEMTIWYVETTGDDLNVCSDPLEPCRTLGEALSRADADDKINIGEGTFNEVGTDGSSSFNGPYSIGAASLWITGSGIGMTIIDFGGVGGMYIWGPGNYRLENFTVQNGGTTVACLTISDRRDRELDLPTINTATIENVEATDCWTGIRIFGTGERILANVVASNNSGTGLGVYDAYEVNVRTSEFNGNSAFGIEADISTVSICCSTEVDGNGGAITTDGVAYGGGIDVLGGTVTISETNITNNGAPGGSIDPAVRADGESSVSITDSLIDENIQGVGSFNDSNLLVENTIITHNAYEGVFAWGGEVHLYHVDVRSNCIRPETEGCWGGGVTSYEDGIVEIRDSYVTGNSHGFAGGVFNGEGGELNILGSTITGNEGSCGINNQAQAVISNSLIANNQPAVGDPPVRAICNYETLSIDNSTISNNNGTGIETNGGELSLSFVTIADNDEVGLSVTAGDLVRRVNNVLIANNSLQDCVGSAEFSSVVLGTNIDTDGSCPDSFVSYSLSELLLSELGDHGGPTLTQALLPGSPAMDAATGTCLEVDQRFVSRPVGPACDVGAYEAGASATSLELTATPETDTLIVKEDFPCYTGPGSQYDTQSTLKAGTQLNVVGYSFAGGWFVAAHPTLQGNNCWIDEDFVETDVPVGDLRLIAVPPKPTATPSPSPEPREEVQPTVCITVPPNNGTVCQ
jgi:hypothetical protein